MSRVSWLEIEHHAMPLKNVMQVQSANPNRNRRPTRKRQISTAPTQSCEVAGISLLDKRLLIQNKTDRQQVGS